MVAISVRGFGASPTRPRLSRSVSPGSLPRPPIEEKKEEKEEKDKKEEDKKEEDKKEEEKIKKEDKKWKRKKIKGEKGEERKKMKGRRQERTISSPKASNGQRFPCPALLSPWFSWGEAGQRPR